MTNLTDTLVTPLLGTDPAGPRVTFYDDGTGERIELSTLTLANWAAKTANLLRDEVGVNPGDRVRVALPAHWQSAAVYLGLWWAGATVAFDGEPATVGIASEARVSEIDECEELVVLSLHPFGRAAADLPLGATDYATNVRAHGDNYVGERAAGDAFDGHSTAEVLATARVIGEREGWSASSRVLSTLDWDTPEALTHGLIAVFVAGASLVQVANLDADGLERRITSEKVTARLG